MFSDIWETLNAWADQLKSWIFDFYDNPGLWLLLFGGLLIIIMIGYHYLNRK